jgi:uncharacterized membrane protein
VIQAHVERRTGWARLSSVMSRLRAGDWAAAGMAVVFTIVFSALMIRRHDAFHTFALDLAKFDQAIWNTLLGSISGRGRFLFSTLQNQSILANHFSPYMALLSPLFLIWPNVRLLFLVQTAGLAVAGLLLYGIVRRDHPAVAPWFLLAFYLNPALHEVALVEFRRVTLAVPWLALAAWGLYVRRRWWMVLGLALALLCKEDIALIVLMFGVHVLLFQRDWRWGAPLVAVGLAWAIGVTFWVVPAFEVSSREGPAVYSQMNYFCLEGDTYGEMLAYVLRDPLVLLRRIVERVTLRTLWRVFLPVGLVLPLLAPDWLLIVVPSIAYMLMSCTDVRKMTGWYTASILPSLFAAVAVGLNRRPVRLARLLVAGLLCATLAGFVMFSHAPLGAKFEPALYRVTAHHRLAAQVVDGVPDGARVAAQDPYVPHLSHREHIYLYPWISIPESQIEYVVLDRHLNAYPLQPPGLNRVIDDLVADTRYVVEQEVDGIFLFHRGGVPLPAYPVGRVAGETMRLDRLEVAVQDESGFYRARGPRADGVQSPLALVPGQQVRVSLYWEALADVNAERTVSVRVSDVSGALAAQYDNMPGQGKKPTSWWREGWRIRDVYYMTVSPQAQRGPGNLNVVVYDSYGGETVLWDDGSAALHAVDVEVSS